MSVGKRIRHIRKRKGVTQKALGLAVGFPEKQADIRMNQYESGSRTPNRALLEKMASVLGVSVNALNVPDIKDNLDLLHHLFALEDAYGFQISRSGSYTYFILGDSGPQNTELQDLLLAWSSYAQMLKTGQISQEEYDHWRYTLTFPKPKKRTLAASRGKERKL